MITLRATGRPGATKRVRTGTESARAATFGLALLTMGLLAQPAADAASQLDFSTDPGFELLASVEGTDCVGGWEPATETLALDVAGSPANFTCALVGGVIGATEPVDAFSLSYDFMVPERPSAGFFAPAPPALVIAPTSSFQALVPTTNFGLKVETPLSGAGLRMIISSAGAPFSPMQILPLDDQLAIGTWYHVRVLYSGEEETLDLRVTERDSGVIVTDGVAPFVLQSGFDRLYLTGRGLSAGRNLLTRIDNFSFSSGGAVQAVSVEVRADDRRGCIKPGRRNDLKVLILGTQAFDVATVEPSSMALSGLAVAERRRGKSDALACRQRDANRDGITDLVCRFRDEGTLELGADGTAVLTGALIGGGSFEGSDTVCIAEPRRHGKKGKRGKKGRKGKYGRGHH